MGVFDFFKKKATGPSNRKNLYINTKEELSFPLGYTITSFDKSDKKFYKSWISKYDQKRKSEIIKGFAIDGNYGQKLSNNEKRVVDDFNIIFNKILDSSNEYDKNDLLYEFLNNWDSFNRSRSIKISKSYFIWCCEIISLTIDMNNKFK